MKKLIIILILLTIFVKSYSQKNIIGLTTSPLAPSIGTYFISKPIFETQFPISFYSSFEYANYKSIDTKLFKLVLGSSFLIHNFLKFSYGKTQDINIELGLSFNSDPEGKTNNYKELSFETGFTIKIIKEVYISLLTDPLNQHFKFGIGLGF